MSVHFGRLIKNIPRDVTSAKKRCSGCKDWKPLAGGLGNSRPWRCKECK